MHLKRESSGLDHEQKRLVKLRYERFVRAGAKLKPDEKAAVGKLNEQLAALFTEFSSKVLERLIGPVFNYIANTFIEAFVRRAQTVYGSR